MTSEPIDLDAEGRLALALLPELTRRAEQAEVEVERLKVVLDGYRVGPPLTGRDCTPLEVSLLEHTERAEQAVARVRELTYASDDGTEYEHSGLHPDLDGHPECPACWVDDIRRAIDEDGGTP